MRAPTFEHERELITAGHTVIGIDEAGCGCLAGPVVAAAVQFPLDSHLGLIRDSKLLSVEQRERLFAEFERRGYRWAIGVASHDEIDAINIRQATYLAMRRAVDAFLEKEHSNATNAIRIPLMPAAYSEHSDPDSNHSHVLWFALVDAWTIPGLSIPQRGIVHGDRLVKSIAAASIIAKVTRDRMMIELDQEFPKYGFAQHKGYATTEHRRAIGLHGLSSIHRKTFCLTMSAQ